MFKKGCEWTITYTDLQVRTIFSASLKSSGETRRLGLPSTWRYHRDEASSQKLQLTRLTESAQASNALEVRVRIFRPSVICGLQLLTLLPM